MFSKLVFSLALCLVAMTAAAQTTREKLQAPGNIPFGLSFTGARPSSLANFEASTDSNKNNILIGDIEILGLPFAANYTFGNKNTLSTVYAVASGPVGDYAVCRERWNKVRTAFEGEYGAADESKEDWDPRLQLASFKYAFKDSGNIEGRITGCLLMVTYTAAPQAAGAVQSNTVWKGEITQETQTFPAVISIDERSGDLIKGKVDFMTSQGVGKLVFEGTVVDGSIVVWMTDKLEGNVTYPGLYIGKLDANRISGTWSVPSAKQYGRFSVKRVP
jgi:hypothetical protein